jgi:hypothetical protein
MNTTPAAEFDRTDEATFRTNVPRTIGTFTILEVAGYRPGTRPGSYATAYALSTDGTDGTRWCTHQLVCADDHASDALHWYVYHGHYDFETRNDAARDLIKRAYGALIS